MLKSISKFLTAGAVVGAMVVFGLLAFGNRALAAVGDLTVTVTREADVAAVSGAAISIDCDDDDQPAALTAMGTTNGSGQLLMSKAAIEATGCIEPGSSGGEDMTIYAAKDGYVTKSVLYDWHDHNDNLTTSVTGLQFAYRITGVTSEATNTSLIASLDSALTVGDSTGLTACVLSGGNYYCPTPLTQSDGSLVARVQKAGYVDKNGSGNYALTTPTTRLTNAAAQVSSTVANVQFTYVINVLNNELNANIMPTSGTPWTASGGLTLGTQTYNSNHWYLALSGSGNLAFDLDGYVRANITASPSTSSQTVSTNDYIDVRFSHKIVIVDEIGTALTPTTVTAGSANVSCSISGNTAYCPILLANDDAPTTNGYIISKDGYVRTTATGTTLAGNRTSGGDAQQVRTLVAGTGLQYAVKATVVDQANGVVTGATVTAGNDYSTTCVESGSTGIYYCPVPVADTYFTVRAAKTGYSTGLQNHTDRTADTDVQQAVSISLNSATATSTSGGGSGSSGGASGYATTNTDTSSSSNTQPSDSSTTSNTSTSSDSSLLMKTVAEMILEEKVMLAAKNATGVSYFMNSGTPSTMKIGAGERGAAVSSFKEAYGKNPSTEADWENVLNIANGRWPLAVDKTVEARAYVNFRSVYGRNANMKNSTDVNALKMMGYGVRSTKARDMKVEASAIARFKATFGFAPTTARHWNVVRAIAYSGVTK